ncbi:MAG: hypothetical protein PHD01_16100 [Geobacteraceae bacterium]|nr:hypothetical protein [Geobacteraceae bacterium]
MSVNRQIQNCVICAWRGECQKKFCIPDGGQRCPDYTRDISVKTPEDDQPEKKKGKVADLEER